MQWIALLIVIAAGVWLVAIAGLMAVRPAYCIHLLQRMSAGVTSGNWRLNLSEQGLRILAGAALIVRAPESGLPALFAVAGGFLVGSSLIILALPMRWHGAYGHFWGDRLKPIAVRLLSPLPLLAGACLIYAAL